MCVEGLNHREELEKDKKNKRKNIRLTLDVFIEIVSSRFVRRLLFDKPYDPRVSGI